MIFDSNAMAQILTCDLSTYCGESSCINCERRPLSLLDGMNVHDLAILEEDRSSRNYKAGEVLFHEGEPSKGLFCLHTGKVKITKSGLFDNALVTALKRPVDFLGIKALILDANYDYTATALEDSIVCLLEKSHFLQVLKTNIELSSKVMRLLAQELSNADERMLNLTQKHMRGRLADALLLLLSEYGTHTDQMTLNIQLKRADLAAMANMTVANAIRVLSVFAKENLIETNKRQIIIKDLEGLKRVSQLG